MTYESVELLLIGKLQFQFRVIVINQRELVMVNFNQPEFAWFERLPGEKRGIHYREYNGE